MTRFLLLLALAALVLPLDALAQCTQPRAINVAMRETSTGPYTAGDTFEATFDVWTSGTESMGTSTMVVDFNDAALSFPASPVKGTDYQWFAYDGFPRPTVNGGIAAYNGEVRFTSSSRLTPFVELQFTADAAGEGEAIPATPTAAFVVRWTVVDPEAGFAVTPRSQQFFNGPGGPTGCFDAGTFAGLEVGQREVTGDRGWRMLSAPAPGFSIADAAAFNYVQGYENLRVNQEPNLLAGYDGTDFVAPADPTADVPSGIGLYWFLYDQDFTRGPSTSVPLPMTLLHSGPSVMNQVAGGLLPDEITIPLHTDGNAWNLLGNPTSTPIDATQFVPVGGALATPVVQVWQDNVGNDGSGTYVLSTDPTLGGVIAGWQGFFAENSTATGLTIPASARTSGGTFLKGAAPFAAETRREPAHTIAFHLTGRADASGRSRDADNAKFEDRAAVLVLDRAAEAGQDALDVSKLTPFGNRFATISFVGERRGVPILRAQEARPLTDEGALVELAFEAAGVDGAYTLEWDRDALPEVAATLLDRETGTTVDLHEVASYRFRAGATRPARAAAEFSQPASLVRSPLAPETARFVLALGRALPEAGTTTAKGADGLPDELGLEPARPNPFRETTALHYALPEAGPVRIDVVDLLGRTVAEIVDEERAAGYHTATFSPRDLAAGVYVVRLEAGGELRTQRITIVR